MKATGIAVIVIALLVPFLWLPGIANGRDVIALASQYLGMSALIAMAISQIIATRWLGVEAVFGPLDQAYRVHKWLGIGAMVAILLHDTIDAEMRGLGRETVLVEVAETAGEISLYGLLILVVITIATFIPYHLWKWTHRLIGAFFVLGAFHFVFILKPFSMGDPLGAYMLAVCALGTIAYAYTSAPRQLRSAREYRIASVSGQGDAVALEMAPASRPLRHRSGQFAVFAFTGAGMTEPHPFTISSAPRDDGSLRVTVAPLGDLTARLSRAIGEGQSVRVQGPFGRFSAHAKKPQVWIAAGIGITPFLALAESLGEDGPPVTLIYSVKSSESAAHLDDVRKLADANPRLTLNVWESSQSGRLTGSTVASLITGAIADAHVLFCGPAAMRRALAITLAAEGLKPRHFHYEEFEIRTGLGLRRFAEWIWKRSR